MAGRLSGPVNGPEGRGELLFLGVVFYGGGPGMVGWFPRGRSGRGAGLSGYVIGFFKSIRTFCGSVRPHRGHYEHPVRLELGPCASCVRG